MHSKAPRIFDSNFASLSSFHFFHHISSFVPFDRRSNSIQLFCAKCKCATFLKTSFDSRNKVSNSSLTMLLSPWEQYIETSNLNAQTQSKFSLTYTVGFLKSLILSSFPKRSKFLAEKLFFNKVRQAFAAFGKFSNFPLERISCFVSCRL
jgi:hypothetical protein